MNDDDEVFEKIDSQDSSLREKGALIYHKSGIVRSPRENEISHYCSKYKNRHTPR